MVFFWGNKKGSSERKKLCFTLFMNPMDGDLKGYCSGKCTLTFQTPPSYGVPLGPKNLTTNSSRPLRMVTSCLLSINLITSVSMRRLPALGDDMVVGFHSVVFFTSSRGGELNWRRSWLGSIADPGSNGPQQATIFIRTGPRQELDFVEAAPLLEKYSTVQLQVSPARTHGHSCWDGRKSKVLERSESRLWKKNGSKEEKERKN